MILETMSEGIMVLDSRGRISYANAALAHMVGVPVHALIARTLSEVFEGWEGLPPIEDKEFAAEGGTSLSRRNGREYFELTLSPLSPVGNSNSRLAVLRNISERKWTEEVLQHQATHDGLTGLPNRHFLYQRLEHALEGVSGPGRSAALLLMDLDGFKDVNDTLGHHAGDLVLLEVGHRLRAKLRPSDTVARLGGDEFAVVLQDAGDTFAVSAAAGRLLGIFDLAFEVDNHLFDVRASIGIALSPHHGSDVDTLLRRADAAMYAAKRARSGFAIYSPELDLESANRLALLADLNQAIARDQLVLHYQPIMSLETGRLVRVEALVRWQHPRFGLLPPDRFVPVAEHAGLIRHLTEWVLDTALRQCSEWRRAGVEVALAVNLSPRNLHDPTLAETVERLLARWGVLPSCLLLEVTESGVMAEPLMASQVLGRLRAAGVQIAVDDFGTGHSSFSQLKRLPVDELKIDRSFVGEAMTSSYDAVVVRSTIELAHELGLAVVAEGVESGAVRDFLAQLGCNLSQGYYVSRPLAASDLFEWLRHSSGESPASAGR